MKTGLRIAAIAIGVITMEPTVAQKAEQSAAAPPADLFAVRNWQPPPPKAKPLPPPKPVPPPLPFRYSGRLNDGEETTAILMRDQRVILVRANDVIDGIYRVDELTASRIVLTYLPLQAQQTIETGRHP